QRVVLGASRPRGALAKGGEVLAKERVSKERRRLLREIVLAARKACTLLDEAVARGFLLVDLLVGLRERGVGRVERALSLGHAGGFRGPPLEHARRFDIAVGGLPHARRVLVEPRGDLGEQRVVTPLRLVV